MFVAYGPRTIVPKAVFDWIPATSLPRLAYFTHGQRLRVQFVLRSPVGLRQTISNSILSSSSGLVVFSVTDCGGGDKSFLSIHISVYPPTKRVTRIHLFSKRVHCVRVLVYRGLYNCDDIDGKRRIVKM